MRIISTVFAFIMCLSLLGCSSGSEINARSMKTATRSVSMIKNRLPTEKRIEFEISFWAMRDAHKKKSEFLSIVDGKTADEMIELGKENFQQHKNDGFEKYTQYASWDQMIATFTQERIDQSRRKKPSKDRKAGNPSVLYSL
jgi:hypothetical protein